MIKIIAIGKKHEDWVSVGIERYQKRLKKPFDVSWVFLAHSAQTGLVARENESEAILSRLKHDDYVILLDEKGQNVDSLELSSKITFKLNQSAKVVVLIGGAYGVDERVIERADFVWSLSKLVFPHQLVRLILTEQIYRTQEISLGNPYHHE
jgi:23S rRNA (pseudouridine1915-N3)-methyltransferase